MAESSRHLFCFGLGFSALALIDRLRAEGGWRFSGTCRGATKCSAMAARGIVAQVFDGNGPLADPAALASATHVLVSAPPEAGGDPVLRWLGEDIARLKGIAWFGYLSTTGVYGDRQGAWVDETAAVAPSQERSRRRAEAEAAWLALHRQHGVPVHLFRLAGIYGPGRNALENVLDGSAHRVVKPGQVFARIHVEDIAATLAASMAKPNPGAAYNLADDEPAPPQDVVAFAAELLGVPPPPEVPFAEAKLSPMGLSFYAENKRVANRRIKEELGVRLRYPTYREGLRALLPTIRR